MQGYVDVADADQARSVLPDCIGHVNSWCMSRRLQLNAGKTELIWFEPKANHVKLSANNLDLQVGVDTIHPATSLRDLGVLLDPEVTMSNQGRQHLFFNFAVNDRSDI